MVARGRRPLLSVVVPVYNNSGSLPSVVASLGEVAAREPDYEFEFIFVDDGSADSSYDTLLAAREKEPRLRIVKFSRNFGSTAALLAGLNDARGIAVVTYAADMQEPPELMNEMIASWRSGNRVVLAARDSRDEDALNVVISNVFYALFTRFALPGMPRGGFDMFLLDRAVCDHIVRNHESNVYLPGLVLWYGFRPAVIRYHRQRRKAEFGRSGWTHARRLKYMIDAFTAFTYVPLRLAAVLGFGLAALGFVYAIVVVIARITTRTPTEGWSALMVALLIISGVQLMIVGTLGEYLWRVLDQVRGRPRFVVDHVVAGTEDEVERLTEAAEL